VRRKLVWGALGLTVLTLVLIHTPLVEDRIRNVVIEQAAGFGISLEIDDLDLNLFALSVTLRGVRANGMGLDADLARVYANAKAAMLTGSIALDEVSLSDGYVAYTPQPAGDEPEPETGPLELPAIVLDAAEIRDVALRLDDQTTALDFSIDDFAFDYDGSRLVTGFSTPAMTLADREIPPLALTLRARTEDFTEIRDVELNLLGPESWFDISGRLDEGFAPHLALEAEIAADLLPEQPGLHISVALDPAVATLKVTGRRELLAARREFTLDAVIDMADPTALIPVEISLDGLAAGRIEISRVEDCLDGAFLIEGNTDTIEELVPRISADSLALSGFFFVRGDDVRADALLTMKGEQTLSLGATWADGTLSFAGRGRPLPNGEVLISGSHGDQTSVAVRGNLPDLEDLSALITLPEGICAGPMSFSGLLVGEDGSFEVEQLLVRAEAVRATDLFPPQDLAVVAAGPFTDLRGTIDWGRLNPHDPIVSFALDLENGQWRDLAVTLDSENIAVMDYETRLELTARGSGPLTRPVLWGSLGLDVISGGPIARLASSFRFDEELLDVGAVRLETAHGALAGEGSLWLGDPLRWTARGTLQTGYDVSYDSVTEACLPRFLLSFEGDQENLNARLYLPDQVLPIQQAPVPISAHQGFEMAVVPSREVAEGSSTPLRVAGIDLTGMILSLESGELLAETEFDVVEPDLLATTLAAWWPEDLGLTVARGKISLVSNTSFEDPRFSVRLDEVRGVYGNGDFEVVDAGLAYTDRLEIDEPFAVEFAGVNGLVSQADRRALTPGTWEPVAAESPVAVALDFELDDFPALSGFLELPDELIVDNARGRVTVHADPEAEHFSVGFDLGEAYGTHDIHELNLHSLEGVYQDGLWLRDLDAEVDNLRIGTEPLANGFRITANPTAEDLALWLEDATGDAELEVDLNWRNLSEGTTISVQCRQKSGRLIIVDPWMEITGLEVDLLRTPRGFQIRQANAGLNEGTITLSGEVAFAEQEDVRDEVNLTFFAESVNLEMLNYKARVTVVAEYVDGPEHAGLTTTVQVGDAYLTPELKIRGLVTDLLAEVPELYFPDPEMERIALQANIVTENPIIVEHDIGYLELETPTLVIGGNLAEPTPYSGVVSINEGSALDLGNRVYIFKESQIQFHPNRINDPYLQLALESSQFGQKTGLDINGYLSELGQNVDSDSLTDILANYLVSQVSTLVSLQMGDGETLFDDSFTFVVSTPITRWLVTRYAVPITEGKESQRFELTMGPFYYNFINLIQESDQVRGNIQYARGFGYLEREKIPEIRRVRFPKELDRSFRKGFKLRRWDAYSDTQWRRAELDLRRRLKARGYLDPTIDHQFENGTLRVGLDPGPKTELEVDGLEITERERGILLRTLRAEDAAGLRAVERRVERLAIERNYPYAAAFADREEGKVAIDVRKGHSFSGISIDFGKAAPILDPLYAKEEARNGLVAAYLASADAAEGRIRAQLAAKGYLLPEIEEGDFIDLRAFRVPVDPGARGKLAAIELNGAPYKSDLVGKPFDYTMIGALEERLAKTDKSAVIEIKPIRRGGDVVLEVTMRAIPDPIIKQLDIEGAARITEARVRRFVGFRDEMKQEDLVRAQRRLIEAGPYRTVRLQSTEESARLLLEEGNRWDLELQLSYDEVDELGGAVRFIDHQLMNRFMPFAGEVEQNQNSETLRTQLEVLRVAGSPISLAFGVELDREIPFRLVAEDEGPFSGTRDFNRSRSRSWRAEMSYDLSRHQEVTLGFRLDQTTLQTRTDFYDSFFGENPDETFDPGNLVETTFAETQTDRFPLRLSWLVNRLDHPTEPANGIFASLSAEQFLDLLNADPDLLGTWFDSRLSSYVTRGRWMWSQRYELGVYRRESESQARNLDDPDELPFFLLGGARTVRGFRLHHVGPLRRIDDELIPFGGEAVVFFSQELSFDTRLYGLGINPFIDGGWAWAEYEDLLSSPLAISGGVGLSMDTPIGYFRINWARPISDGSFGRLIDDLLRLDEDRDALRDQALEELTFVFGRTF